MDEDDNEAEIEKKSATEEKEKYMDYRIRWIRDRVLKFLGLTNQEHLFDNLINANNRYYEDKLLNFLILDLYGVSDLEKKLIFFYKTYVSEVIQEEISVWEEKKVEKLDDDGKKKDKRAKKQAKKDKAKDKADISPSDSSVSTLHGPDSSEQEEKEGDDNTLDVVGENGSGDFSSRKKEETKALPIDSSNFVPPPGEEDKYVLTKKMMEKVRKVPMLHMICGQIDGSKTDLQDVTFFYFMRTSDEGIPSFDTYEECLGEITGYVVVGSLSTKFLPSLNRILIDVFKPLVENQFRGPEFFELRKKTDSDIDAVSTERVTPTPTGIEYQTSRIRRPSVFRKISAKLESDEEDIARPASILQDEDSKRRRPKSSRKPSAESKSSRSSPREMRTHPIVEQSKKDILNYLDNLTENVTWTLEHIEDDMLLTVPNIPELNDPAITDEMLIKNKDIVEQMEETVMLWEKHIQKVSESYANKAIPGKGPLAEYQYWQKCEIVLIMLIEQLKMPAVKRILALLEQTLSPIAVNFQYFQTELWKRYVEARDNNKFLQTLLRYLQLIAESDSFKSIEECIPSLMEGLRMLWVLSSYYCHEEKMVMLMDRISWDLCQNVRRNLAIMLLFKKPLEVILEKTKAASAMLKQWKRSYLKTRLDIELSGKGTRWEFDQKRLFQETEYIAGVCGDLHKIADVLQDFYNIFGSDLKSIINDPAQIDAVVKRVGALVVPIEEADFDIFNVFNKENWEAMTTWFYEEVTYLEDQAKFYIDECFTVLINAENALEMLLKFKNIKTRTAIQRLLLRKFDVIMHQFSNEISTVENIFHRGRRSPPLLTYHPPMAGAIYWARQLFHRLRRPVLIFQEVRELKHSELKLLAFNQYFDLAKQLKEYEETKYNMWLDRALLAVNATMKKSVLRMVRVERDTPATLTFSDEERIARDLQLTYLSQKVKSSKDATSIPSTSRESSLMRQDVIISKPSAEIESFGGESSGIVSQSRLEAKPDHGGVSSLKEYKTSSVSSDKHETRAKISWTEFMSGAILLECQLRFQLNFDREIFEVVREAELMEQLGFELPAAVRDVGVQKHRLRTDIDTTEEMINRYNSVLDTFDKADIQLLKQTLLDVEKYIQPGVTRFNWNSLTISDYAADCQKMLKNLNSVVEQVNQMKKELDNRIESELQSYHLFSTKKEVARSEVLLPCKIFFLEIKNRRSELVSLMSKAYRSIGPMLVKLESLVLSTATGKSPAMQLLYEKYEKKIFAAFIICMVRNMEVFNKMLNDTKPMFKVDAILISSEVVLRPSASEIYSIICSDMRDLLERLKEFSRWMNGTCLECEPQRKEFSEDLIPFSFFEDVLSIRVVDELIRIVHETAQKISMDCWRYLQRWKKYSNLWSFDKKLVCEKFAATKPTILQYDEKLTFYENILEELKDMMPYFDINSIRVNLEPLLSGIEDQAKEWKQVLGNHLLSDTVKGMSQLKSQIETYRRETELVVTGLDSFMSIMQAITDVKNMAIQAEVQFLSYQECFQIMRAHAIDFSSSDEAMAYKLQHDWESLYLGALYRSSTLESTTDRFREMTEHQLKQFLDEIAKFAEDFEAHGPASIGENLDLGLKKMEEYGKLIDKHEEKRLNLMKFEVLFDLPSTDYSTFLKIKTEYKNMEILYDLYEKQMKARDDWAKTLWVNLNPQQLIEGMDHFTREFRRLPKSIKSTSVARALETNMKNFKDSVPLFIELKNEAMRERHWQQLMKRTGQHFDMDPDRCADDG